MKSVKMGKHKKNKIVQFNATHAVGVGKVGKSPEMTLKVVSDDSPKPQITHEMIAQRAWSIWMSRGCKPGQDEMNWHQAELELKSARNKKGNVYATDNE